MSDIPTLYIVPTPIGNLADITQRALDVLRSVDLVAAEDTRHTGILLSHYQISVSTFALHDHNEQQKADVLIARIKEGKSVALVSDAGTPLISDPGYHLVTRCREAGVKVVPLPGPCAAITALSAAGLPTDRFAFEGFLPAKAKGRDDRLQAVIEDTRSLVFYESPRRVQDTVCPPPRCWPGSERTITVAAGRSCWWSPVPARWMTSCLRRRSAPWACWSASCPSRRLQPSPPRSTG